MRVRAIKVGFHGGALREPGKKHSIFDIPDKPTRKLRPSDSEAARKVAIKGEVPAGLARWMEPVTKADLDRPAEAVDTGNKPGRAVDEDEEI